MIRVMKIVMIHMIYDVDDIEMIDDAMKMILRFI